MTNLNKDPEYLVQTRLLERRLPAAIVQELVSEGMLELEAARTLVERIEKDNAGVFERAESLDKLVAGMFVLPFSLIGIATGSVRGSLFGIRGIFLGVPLLFRGYLGRINSSNTVAKKVGWAIGPFFVPILGLALIVQLITLLGGYTLIFLVVIPIFWVGWAIRNKSAQQDTQNPPSWDSYDSNDLSAASHRDDDRNS